MPNFNSVTQWPVPIRFGPGPTFQLFIVPLCELRRSASIAGQQFEELSELCFVPTELGRKLPQDRSELFTQTKEARGKKVSERDLNVAQAFHVRDETAAFHAKNEAIWCLLIPPSIARWTLERIKRAVNFNRVELPAREFQRAAMRQTARIENTAPWFVIPSRNADPDITLFPLRCHVRRHSIDIPKRIRKIAQRFNAGSICQSHFRSPDRDGRNRRFSNSHSTCVWQRCFFRPWRDSRFSHSPKPSVKTLGYGQDRCGHAGLRGKRTVHAHARESHGYRRIFYL